MPKRSVQTLHGTFFENIKDRVRSYKNMRDHKFLQNVETDHCIFRIKKNGLVNVFIISLPVVNSVLIEPSQIMQPRFGVPNHSQVIESPDQLMPVPVQNKQFSSLPLFIRAQWTRADTFTNKRISLVQLIFKLWKSTYHGSMDRPTLSDGLSWSYATYSTIYLPIKFIS